ELHIIGDDLYIFFAGSDGTLEESGVFGNIHSHVMKLKKDGDPLNANDWEKPIRVQNKHGDYLFDSGITLDMTCFELDRKYYVILAQKYCMTMNLHSLLYNAKIEPRVS